MFAIAVWDTRDRALWLVRDRLGKKPLYYGRADDGAWLFGSELKALRAHPACPTPRSIAMPLAALSALRLRAGAARRSTRASPSCRPAMLRCDSRTAGAGASSRTGEPATSSRRRLAARREIGDDEAIDEARSAAARCGAPPDGCRRAARRVPLGRHRLVDRRRADAGAERRSRSHLHHRLRRARLRRGRRAPRRSPRTWAPSTPSCTSRREEALARDPAPAGDLRRAVRRLVADPDAISSRSWRASTSPWRCPATAATSCSAATPATSAAGQAWRRIASAAARAAPAGRRRRCAASARERSDAAAMPSASGCCRPAPRQRQRRRQAAQAAPAARRARRRGRLRHPASRSGIGRRRRCPARRCRSRGPRREAAGLLLPSWPSG